MTKRVILHLCQTSVHVGCSPLKLKNMPRLMIDEDYFSPLTDIDYLYESFLLVKAAKPNKIATLKYEEHLFENLAKLAEENKYMIYKKKYNKPFIINERGKTRKIQGSPVKDKVNGNALARLLINRILPSLTYSNCASIKNRGTDLARLQLQRTLERFFSKYETNEGYILLFDISKYFDNLRHDIIWQQVEKYLYNDVEKYAVTQLLDSFKIDVSWMSDKEYENCLNTPYNSLDHLHEKETGNKFMNKGCHIGAPESQVFGVLYLNPVDHALEQDHRVFKNGRFMDDFWCIVKNKEDIAPVKKMVYKMVEKELGLFINKKKSHVFKLSKKFKYLNRHYFMTNTGKVVINLDKKTLKVQKHKLKENYKKAMIVDTPFERNRRYEYIEKEKSGWHGVNDGLMSNLQHKNMKEYEEKYFFEPLPIETYIDNMSAVA